MARSTYKGVEHLKRAVFESVVQAQEENKDDAFGISQQRVPRSLGGEDATDLGQRLAESGHAEVVVDGKRVSFVITYSTEYAGVQEKGYQVRTLKDGRQILVFFRHYTTPGTGAHYVSGTIDDYWHDYLQNVADTVERNTGIRMKVVS